MTYDNDQHKPSLVDNTCKYRSSSGCRGRRRVGQCHARLRLGVAGSVMAVFVALASCSPVFAVVVISDGFGDADLNNNGMPLEDVDVNVQGSLTDTTYVPGRLEDGSGTEPANNEVEAVVDPSDTGIRWIQIRGFTDAANSSVPGAGNSKPTIRIVDDSQGAMLETKPGSEPGGLGIAAIDAGYAMSWESRGGGSSAAGFFDRRIALGPEVDDEVKVSFDFRIWRDAPNLNGTLTNNEPLQGELRFGLYQDTDEQIGQTNPFAGRQVDANGDPLPDQLTQFVPAVWGSEEGLFEGSLTGQHGAGDDVGTHGDNGWFASVWMGNPLLPNGGQSRIREEVQTDRILQGQDVQTIAQPENMAPGPFDPPEFDFINLDLAKVYNIELSLKRATEDNPGDTIFAALTIIDKATGEMFSFGDQEDFSDPLTGGIQSDAWDYFAIRNASSGSGEFDFILDNFLVEVIGSNVDLTGDFNNDGRVDAADYVFWRKNISTPEAYSEWLANFGASLSPAGGASLSFSAGVPEPSCVVLLCFGGAAILAIARHRS